VAPTSTLAEALTGTWARLSARRRTRAWHSMEYSFSRSLRLAGLIAHHGNEQIGDAGRTHFAQIGELFAIYTFEEQDTAPEHLALVHWTERPRCSDLRGIHRHFRIARLEFFHAAVEHDPATVDEHHIGEDVLYFFHLMGGHDDRALAIEVVVQQ